MVRAMLTRSATTVLGLVVAVTSLLVLLRAAPGDAVDLLTTDSQLRAQLTAAYQLDVSLPTALLRTLTGQWGTSVTVRPGADVRILVADGLWQSGVVLVGTWLATAVAGTILAGRHASGPARWPSILVIPVFLLGWLLIVGINETVVFFWRGGMVDRPSWFSLPDTASPFRTVLSIAVLTLGSGNLRAFTDALAGRFREHRGSAAVEALEARGQPAGLLVMWLVLPDLAVLLAERAVLVFGSLVVLERVFGMPGFGALFWEACVQRDQPVVLACGVTAAAFVALVRWLADIVRVWADPRLRLAVSP